MMDRFIRGLETFPDGDLTLCPNEGIAFQTDMTVRADYGADYFEKCAGYEDSAIATKINDGRIALVGRHLGHRPPVVDIGIGSGEFIKKRPNTFGTDVNPVALEWLRKNDRLAGALWEFPAFTFWDVIEHLPEPEDYFRQIQLRALLFTSVPIMKSLDVVRESKHYRPGEHLYYFTETGFVFWMRAHGFGLIEHATFEIDAGRDSIHSFAFKRLLWP
jgi:hypothetical protein